MKVTESIVVSLDKEDLWDLISTHLEKQGFKTKSISWTIVDDLGGHVFQSAECLVERKEN